MTIFAAVDSRRSCVSLARAALISTRLSCVAAGADAPDALDLLARHSWPGNIRELRNALEQATLMTDDPVLAAGHFAGILNGAPAVAAARAALPTEPMPAQIKPLPQLIAELEARAIHDALEATGGNKLAASRLLGIARATLYEKLAALEPRP